MKKFTRIAAFLLVALMMVSVAAIAAAEIVVTLPHYKTGENVGAKFFEPQVARFNEKYDGQYEIVIEEITQEMYADKMKQLTQQKKLPFLVEQYDTDWMTNVIVPNGLYYDLTEFLAEHPEVDSLIPDYDREFNTREHGYVSLNYNVVRPIGLYYNADMVALEKAPGAYADWAEFEAALGENKLAHMTGENAWTSVLVLSAMIAQEEGGVELLNAHTVDKLADFSHPAIVNAVAKFQAHMQKFASANTVGAIYADAANTFMSKNAAVIANGSWMVGDFAEDGGKWSNGFDGTTVKAGMFPGNVGIASTTGGYGWFIPATTKGDELEVAKAFLAFMMSKEELEYYMLAEGGSHQGFEPSEEFLAKRAADSVLLDEYCSAVNAETVMIPNLSDCMPNSVAASTFGTLLPKLIDGSYTAEQFCEQLTKAAAEALDL